MIIEARCAGSGSLGSPDMLDEPVWYDIILEQDGASVIAFAGAVQSIMGRGLDHLLKQQLILQIDEGPAVEVTVSALEGDHALLELTRP